MDPEVPMPTEVFKASRWTKGNRLFPTVIEVDANGMKVQFEDRADTTRIVFSDRGWMDFIEVAD